MLTAPTLKRLPYDEALVHIDEGAAFMDLRPIDSYLDVHVPRSLSNLYEFGPGFAGRARDCVPLSLPLILLESEGIDLSNAAGALRGKGFTVLGSLADGINQWATSRGNPASTEIITSDPQGLALDVGDPGSTPVEGGTRIPIDGLWARVGELGDVDRVTVLAGFGVRAAMAVGILERAGKDVIFCKTRGEHAPSSGEREDLRT